MGLTNWTGEIITRQQAEIAKNYLMETELRQLKLLVEQFLAYAELQVERKNPMYMSDWKRKLNEFLKLNDLEILTGKGAISHEKMQKYQNRTIEAAQVIAELVDLARKIRAEKDRGKDIGLTPEEVAFYDALCVNESAIRELGDTTLMQIAREMVSMLRKNTSIDWTIKENVQAKLRVYVKKLLRKYNYPPDKQESATKTVLEQANLLCKDWSGGN